MKKLVLVSPEGGDWVRIYVDGKFIDEGHSVQGCWTALLQALDTDFVGTVEVPEETYENHLGEEEYFDSLARQGFQYGTDFVVPREKLTLLDEE